jgi:hypothetical protein
MGLPGSGKSFWASEKNEANNKSLGWSGRGKRLRVLDFDEVSTGKRKKEYLFESLAGYLKNDDDAILDGLFLSYDDVSKALKEIKSYSIFYKIDKVSIEWWQPMVEYCLYNDRGRRNESSEITIKNAKVDKVDSDFVSRLSDEFPELKGKIEYKFHMVEKKPKWKLFGHLHGIRMDNDGKVEGPSWCLGGSWQNCWGRGGSVAGDAEPSDFGEFDSLLEKVCPNITFLQYKNISSRVMRTEEFGESDYYGGHTNHAKKYFYMNDLYEALVERNIIDEL